MSRFIDKQCQHDHEHASITSVAHKAQHVNSSEAQVWPPMMCRLLVAGIADLVYDVVRHNLVPALCLLLLQSV